MSDYEINNTKSGRFDFLEHVESPTPENDLKKLSKLSIFLKEKRKIIALLEMQLAEAKENERQLSQEEIPMLLLRNSVTSINLEDGSKVSIQEKIRVSLPKKDFIKRNTVMKWIIENGGANIIKRELKIEEPEKGVIDFLKENNIFFEDKKDIHASTLKAWLSSKLGMSKNSLQEIEVGDVPIEANLFIFKETKIK